MIILKMHYFSRTQKKLSNWRRFSRTDFIFLFVVAFFVGAILKGTIGQYFRIGYQDPQTVITRGELYDIDTLEQKILKKGVPEGESVDDFSQ